MAMYCLEKNIPFKINSTVSTMEEDEKYGRVSNTHREGRAIDLSVEGWSENQRLIFCKIFNEKYKKEAAVSGKSFTPLLCVYGDQQHLAHIHIQINKKYAREGLIKISSK